MKTTAGTTFRTLICSILVLIAAPLGAQEGPAPQPPMPEGVGVFGTLGLGVATPDIGGVLSLSVHSSRNAFVLRTSGASEFTIFSPGDTAEDFALLVGRVRERGRGWLRVAAGPALARVTRYSDGYDCAFLVCSYDSEESYVPGLALQAEAVWTPAVAFGLGITAFADVNAEMSYAGLALGVHLGKVRRR